MSKYQPHYEYQPHYGWLRREPAPKMLVTAQELLGVKESLGAVNNPIILGWAKECTIAYKEDSVPWCGLFMAVVAKRAGKPLPTQPLWARSWLRWGEPSPQPELGDVLVFSRNGSGGHVGLYVGEDTAAFHVLGGNQGDAVSIVRINKDRLIGARRYYQFGAPDNVRKVQLSMIGELSKNEV